MPYCPHCGADASAQTRFCADCGTAMESAAAPTATPTQPIAASTSSSSPAPSSTTTKTMTATTAAQPGVDWMRLARGNWLGAAIVAGLTVATAGVLALVLTAMAKPTDFGLRNSLTLVASILNGSFGASLVAHFHTTGESVHSTVAAMPLTVTIAALLVAVLAFRRMIRDYRSLTDALLDAARVALLVGLALLVIAIAFRADSREFGRGWGNQLAHLFDTRIQFGPSIPGSLFVGFLVVLVTLAATAWTRRDLRPARLGRLDDVLAAPLHGFIALVLLLPVAGLVGLVLMLLTGHSVQDANPTSHDFFASAALITGLLASGGFWFISLGAGSTFGEHGSATGAGPSSDYHHLGYFAHQDPGLWAAPVVMVAVLVTATLVVARTARSRETVQASLLAWTGLLVVGIPLLVRLTSVHAGLTESSQNAQASGAIGVNGWLSTLLLVVVVLLCSAGVAFAQGVLDLSRVTDLGRRLQTNPGRADASEPGSDQV